MENFLGDTTHVIEKSFFQPGYPVCNFFMKSLLKFLFIFPDFRMRSPIVSKISLCRAVAPAKSHRAKRHGAQIAP